MYHAGTAGTVSSQSIGIARTGTTFKVVLVAVALIVAFAAFSGGLAELVTRWSRQEEYSHGFLIPVVAAWMLWSRRVALVASLGKPSWTGIVAIFVAGMMLIVGELSAFFLLSQLGFVVALAGIVLSFGGASLLRVTFVPIAFLVFAIPLPYFIDSELSWRLQLISSELGVYFIRLFGVPVYLTGNVIDLGSYKLQVAEACSGLRYLYPLLSLGFLAAYLFQAPLWQRALVFLSTIPITIVMNSIRISMVGVLVDRWGIAQAEGLLHFFEGWIIFVVCSAVLASEIWLLARFASGKSFFQVFRPPNVTASLGRVPQPALSSSIPLAACLFLLSAAGLVDLYLSGRHEVVPERLRFISFPVNLGPWQGHPSLLEPQIEQVLKPEDYVISDYTKSKHDIVNFYVAYYASQRKGYSPHSPIVCIPGGGWQITRFERTSYYSKALGMTLPLNRVVIARGNDKQLVYYWFVQRGRNIANEYWSKWHLFIDAIIKNRTDGALVRLVTPFYPSESEGAADERLQSFIDELEPRLRAYLPADRSTPSLSSFVHQAADRQS
jgi:exosortase D (VPLPA-CTERM-specific)